MKQVTCVFVTFLENVLNNLIYRLFLNDFKIDRSIPIAPGRHSWFNEYRRLKYLTPTQETEVLTEHTHQVLHVSFSHNGEMFASSSKDGYIKVRKYNID